MKNYDIKKHTFNVICSVCGKEDTVVRRYKNKPAIYICYGCLHINDNTEEKVKCMFCQKEFELISSSHIKKCSNNTITYEQYVEKYGRESVYSKKYRKRLELANTRVDKKIIHDKISNKNKKWWAEHREEHSKKLKIAQNTEKAKANHSKGYLKYWENASPEQVEKRRQGATNSWKRESTREKRIKAINTPESIAARSAGGKKAAFITQQKIPKITKPVLKLSKILKENNIDHELEYALDWYHLDIGLPYYKIAIEGDGDYWHGNPLFYPNPTSKQLKRQADDRRRNTFLANKGWKVLRFWESDINKDVSKCYEQIKNALEESKCS